MNAEFQRIARRDKKAFLSDQYKEIEENNRMGKTRDLFRKIRYQGNISCEDGLDKGQKWFLLLHVIERRKGNFKSHFEFKHFTNSDCNFVLLD